MFDETEIPKSFIMNILPKIKSELPEQITVVVETSRIKIKMNNEIVLHMTLAGKEFKITGESSKKIEKFDINNPDDFDIDNINKIINNKIVYELAYIINDRISTPRNQEVKWFKLLRSIGWAGIFIGLASFCFWAAGIGPWSPNRTDNNKSMEKVNKAIPALKWIVQDLEK